MANIGVELKRLLTKLGGTPSKYDQTNELLHKITDQVNAGGSGGGLVVETEWDEEAAPTASPRFKSNTLGTAYRAAVASGQNVVVHIPARLDYSVPECYITPILVLTDQLGNENIAYVLPPVSGLGGLTDGDDDDDGYVQFHVYNGA